MKNELDLGTSLDQVTKWLDETFASEVCEHCLESLESAGQLESSYQLANWEAIEECDQCGCPLDSTRAFEVKIRP